MAWEVYIVRAENGHLYTGISTDVERRITEHQESPKGAKFFHISSASDIVFREAHPNRSSASRREAQIKRMSRAQKLGLIARGCE